jgi:hypothetical protein
MQSDLSKSDIEALCNIMYTVMLSRLTRFQVMQFQTYTVLKKWQYLR